MFKFVGICFNLRSYGVDLRFLFLASLPPIFQKSRKKIFSKLYLNLLDELLLFSFRLKNNISYKKTLINIFWLNCFSLHFTPQNLDPDPRTQMNADPDPHHRVFCRLICYFPPSSRDRFSFSILDKLFTKENFSKFSFLITFRSELVLCAQEVVSHFI